MRERAASAGMEDTEVEEAAKLGAYLRELMVYTRISGVAIPRSLGLHEIDTVAPMLKRHNRCSIL